MREKSPPLADIPEGVLTCWTGSVQESKTLSRGGFRKAVKSRLSFFDVFLEETREAAA